MMACDERRSFELSVTTAAARREAARPRLIDKRDGHRHWFRDSEGNLLGLGQPTG
jgi:hypothetical protein